MPVHGDRQVMFGSSDRASFACLMPHNHAASTPHHNHLASPHTDNPSLAAEAAAVVMNTGAAGGATTSGTTCAVSARRRMHVASPDATWPRPSPYTHLRYSPTHSRHTGRPAVGGNHRSVCLLTVQLVSLKVVAARVALGAHSADKGVALVRRVRAGHGCEKSFEFAQRRVDGD